MAKKLRKREVRGKSVSVLFVEMLIPWAVMAVVAVGLVNEGVSRVPAFLVGIGTALVVTVFIWYCEKKRMMLVRMNVRRNRRQ